MDPGFHGVLTTHWIRGFMAFRLVRRTGRVMLMVPVWPESGFREGSAAQVRVEAGGLACEVVAFGEVGR